MGHSKSLKRQAPLAHATHDPNACSSADQFLRYRVGVYLQDVP